MKTKTDKLKMNEVSHTLNGKIAKVKNICANTSIKR